MSKPHTKSATATVVADFIARFPKHGNHTLAAAMYKANRELFKDVEAARSAVRRARGNAGARSRDNAPALSTAADRNPYNLPISAASPEGRTFALPRVCKSILVISDLHVPYHDVPALTAAIQYGRKAKVDTVFINGDLLDFHKISRFDSDPRKRSTREEFDTARAVLESLRKAFPVAAIYWLKGNHDTRWEHWLMTKAPELFGDPYFAMEERLGLASMRVKILDDKTIVRAGGLQITHGHTLMRGFIPPVNPARGVFMKAKQSALIGHTHKISEHTETRLDGDIVTCWSAGCLCELSPDYAPHANNYAHGFAHVTLGTRGEFNVKNFRIKDGRIL